MALLVATACLLDSTGTGIYAEEMGNETLVESSANAETTNQETGVTEDSIWDGQTYQMVYTGNGFEVTFNLTGVWDGGYNAEVEVKNTSEAKIDDWRLKFDFNGTITNMWNGVLSDNESADNMILVQNATWNQDIESGASVSFGFSGQGDFPGFPSFYELVGSLEEVAEESYQVDYHLDSDWGQGYTATVSVTNNQDKTLEDWVIEFDYAREITSIWNGTILSHDGNHYVIKNADWNANIDPGATVSFGFLGKEGTEEDQPENLTLSSYQAYAEQPVSLTVNTEDFYYNEVADWYVIDEVITSLSGSLEGADFVQNLTYEILDFKDNKIKAGDITVGETWTIDNFGLSIAQSRLIITVTKKNGQKESFETDFLNMDGDNLANTEADMADTDGDGICNYYESLLGSNPDLADTDGDGLSDLDEFIYIGTDYTLVDTDGNGVADGQEDSDSDGLDNLTEVGLTTAPYYGDTDGDGLSDGDEVLVYFTDPLAWDSDGDGLSDSQDRELGFDPNKIDTDKDGINDGDEKVYQIYSKDIEDEDQSAVTKVSVGLDCSGYLQDDATIIDIYNVDMRTSDVVGLVGAPVDISVDKEFETADITFTYNESALGDTKEENLLMLWYDKENDNYVPLESVVDAENNTVSYTTTHFSTYLLVDEQIWLDNMRMDMNYRNSDDVTYYDIAFVVDVSGSMGGTPMTQTKLALNQFIDAMMGGDSAGIVTFNSKATRVQELTADQLTLSSRVNKFYANGGTRADLGLKEGIQMLRETSDKNQKMIILLCDGDVTYDASIAKLAYDNEIVIHCINVVSGNSNAMREYANATGGYYYLATTNSEIVSTVDKLREKTVSSVDMTDTDGDGLYDVYELNGMRLSNGRIVYTDPNKADSDDDGVSDYDAMGGMPVTEIISIGNTKISCTLNHSNIYGELSSDFIYVDGRVNSDGTQIWSKLGYIPYNNIYMEDIYNISGKSTRSYTMYEIIRDYDGAARIHNLFKDEFLEESNVYIGGRALECYIYDDIIASTITDISLTRREKEAVDVYAVYISGEGGNEAAWKPDATRLTVDATPFLDKKEMNSGYDMYIDNMYMMKNQVEGILNEYNKEAYIATSPSSEIWGCQYLDTAKIDIENPDTIDWQEIKGSLLNITAFGTFNYSYAGWTSHCTYNPLTQEYKMDVTYYLTDFYDYSFLAALQKQDAIGMTRSFELYGKMSQVITWKKGDNKMNFSNLQFNE